MALDCDIALKFADVNGALERFYLKSWRHFGEEFLGSDGESAFRQKRRFSVDKDVAARVVRIDAEVEGSKHVGQEEKDRRSCDVFTQTFAFS